MILISQSGEEYEVRFKYNEKIKDIVKQTPGRAWRPERNCWTVPRDKVGWLIANFKDTPWENDLDIQSLEEIDKNYSIDDTSKIPDIDISDVDMYVQDGLTLFKHQIDAIKYDKWRNEHGIRTGFLLADPPGMSKTCTVFNIAMYHKKRYNSKHCLVITCVNGAKYNWVEDIIKHSNKTIVPYLIGNRKKRNGSERIGTGKEKFEDLVNMTKYGKKDGEPLPYFIVLNIEAFQTKLGRTYILVNRLIELAKMGEIGVIAVDEIHKNASPRSKQGKLLLELKNSCPKDVEWIPMTGTPITSRPTDLYTPLFLIGAHNTKSYYLWESDYCVKGGYCDREIIGYKNMKQLKGILQPNMLKRDKDKSLDLPPKLHHTEYIENTEYQTKLYNQVKEDIKKLCKSTNKYNPGFEFIRMRQVNGSPELVDRSLVVDDKYLSKNAKLSRLLELVEELTQNGEKVMIFSNWVEPLRTIYKFISKKYKTCCYTGTMSPEDREKHKRVFINNPDYKVMIGTVGALGTSHTFTVCRNVIFYDSPLCPSEVEQCEDRCHRAGTTGVVSIYNLVCKDTIDEVVNDILSKKEGTSDFIVDNKLDINKHPELLDLLLYDK